MSLETGLWPSCSGLLLHTYTVAFIGRSSYVIGCRACHMSRFRVRLLREPSWKKQSVCKSCAIIDIMYIRTYYFVIFSA